MAPGGGTSDRARAATTGRVARLPTRARAASTAAGSWERGHGPPGDLVDRVGAVGHGRARQRERAPEQDGRQVAVPGPGRGPAAVAVDVVRHPRSPPPMPPPRCGHPWRRRAAPGWRPVGWRGRWASDRPGALPPHGGDRRPPRTSGPDPGGPAGAVGPPRRPTPPPRRRRWRRWRRAPDRWKQTPPRSSTAIL